MADDCTIALERAKQLGQLVHWSRFNVDADELHIVFSDDGGLTRLVLDVARDDVQGRLNALSADHLQSLLQQKRNEDRAQTR